MKTFVCALILFTVTVVGSFAGSISITRISDRVSEELKALPPVSEEAELSCHEDALCDIFEYWEQKHFIVKILVNHPIKSTIDEQFRIAIGYCRVDDAKEYSAAIEALRNSFHILREVSETSIANIL